MKQKLDVPLGIVVVGLVLLIGCRLIVWWPGVIIGAALILGVLAATWPERRRNSKSARPAIGERPWRTRGLRDAEVPSKTDDQL